MSVENQAASAICAVPVTESVKQNIVQCISEVIATHHKYLRQELPVISRLMENICVQSSGEKALEGQADLIRLHQLWKVFAFEMHQHLLKEEEVLFPWCLEIAKGIKVEGLCAGGVETPIHILSDEHEGFHILLVEIQKIFTRGDSVLPVTHSDWKEFVDRIQALTHDTHVHSTREEAEVFVPVLAIVKG